MLASALAVGVLGACASTGTRPGTCPIAPVDSGFLRGGAVYNACDVDVQAKPTNPDAHPDYRPTSASTTCVSADVEFVVGVSGRPEVETARIVRATNQDFGNSVLVTLPQLRFEPAQRGGVAVREIVRQHPMENFAVVAVRRGESPNADLAHRPPPNAC